MTTVTPFDSATLDRLNKTSAQTASQANATTAEDMQQRFLSLLIAQLKNQDPLNPMDNAQTTTQMAQINTVAGLERPNASISGMAAQSQGLTGTAMLGRTVALADKPLTLVNGAASGSVQLGGAADTVKVEVLNTAGQVIDTVDLGGHPAGMVNFEWKPASSVHALPGDYSFRAKASSAGTDIKATGLVLRQVDSVVIAGSGMKLGLSDGSTVNFEDVQQVRS